MLLQSFMCSFKQPVLWRYFSQISQRDGLDLVSNGELQAKQWLLCLVEIVGSAGLERAERIASLVFLIEKFLTFARSRKRMRTKFLRNHKAALDESGIRELPCIWTVRVE